MTTGTTRLMTVLVAALALAGCTTQRLGQKAPVAEGLAVYGPAPAPLAMLRGRHRFRLLLHAPRSFDLQGTIRDWVASIDWPSKARLAMATSACGCAAHASSRHRSGPMPAGSPGVNAKRRGVVIGWLSRGNPSTGVGRRLMVASGR